MRKAKDAKTGLGPKQARLILILCLLVGILVVVVMQLTSKNRITIWHGNKVTLEVVNTPEAREKGLSNRQSLGSKHGMLFVFGSESSYCFWMKDMRFPIDIIWLNSKKQVVDTKANIAPSTYPTAFCPNKNAQYAVELNAGKAKEFGIKTGDKLNF